MKKKKDSDSQCHPCPESAARAPSRRAPNAFSASAALCCLGGTAEMTNAAAAARRPIRIPLTLRDRPLRTWREPSRGFLRNRFAARERLRRAAAGRAACSSTELLARARQREHCKEQRVMEKPPLLFVTPWVIMLLLLMVCVLV